MFGSGSPPSGAPHRFDNCGGASWVFGARKRGVSIHGGARSCRVGHGAASKNAARKGWTTARINWEPPKHTPEMSIVVQLYGSGVSHGDITCSGEHLPTNESNGLGFTERDGGNGLFVHSGKMSRSNPRPCPGKM